MIEFHSDDIITHVPTCCLIEDYWMIRTALEEIDGCNLSGAKETLHSVMDCLMESIDRFTQVKSGLHIAPSVSSPIAMSCESGIIMDGNEDLKCLAGRPLSHAGIEYCGECPHHGACNPENGEFMLEGGILYRAWGHANEESFLNALEMSQAQPRSIALWGFGEVVYRISVLETCQTFTRMAVAAADTRAQVEHYQMLDAYIQSLALERRYGPDRGPDTQKEREAAQNNLGRVVQDYRKRFASFSPASPTAYANEVNRLVNTIMPAWLMFRETFVPIKKLGEEITS